MTESIIGQHYFVSYSAPSNLITTYHLWLLRLLYFSGWFSSCITEKPRVKKPTVQVPKAAPSMPQKCFTGNELLRLLKFSIRQVAGSAKTSTKPLVQNRV